MSGAFWSAVVVTVLRWRLVAGPARRPGSGVDAWSDRRQDRTQALDRLLLAADRQAEAAVEAPHAAVGADVHVVDPVLLVRGGVPEVIVVVGVAAIDDRVARPSASDAIVLSVISAAGTITHAARGFSSLAANSANDPAPSWPSTSSALTASGETS